MPSVLSDKKSGALMTSLTSIRTESFNNAPNKTKKKHHPHPPIVPKCLIFLVKGKAT